MASKLSFTHNKYKATNHTLELTGNRYVLLTNSPFNHSATNMITVKLITVGTPMSLITSSSGSIRINANKSMTIVQGPGSFGAQTGIKWDITPSQLLAAGIDLQPGLVLNVASQQRNEVSENPNIRTSIPIIYMNGIDVTSFGTYIQFPDYYTTESFMIGASGTSYLGYYGPEIQNGFHLIELVLLNGTNRAALDLQGYKSWINGGRGIKYKYVQQYGDKLTVVQYADPNNLNFGSWKPSVGVGQGAYAPVILPPLSKAEKDRDFKSIFNYRAGDKFVDFGITPYSFDTTLANYLYPGSPKYLRGANIDSKLTGPFQQWDGNLEYPQHLSKELDLQYNAWGSTNAPGVFGVPDANSTTLSDIRNVNAPSFIGRSQTPIGYDHVKFETGIARMEQLLLDDARKAKIEIYPKTGFSETVVGVLRLGSNPLQQTFYELYDPLKIRPEYLDFNYTQSLTGPIRFSTNTTTVTGFLSGVTGNIPIPYPALVELELSNCPNLTGYPAHFADTKYISLAYTGTGGTFIADKAILVNLGEKTSAAANTVLDLRNHTGYMTRMFAITGKISQVMLPTTGQSIINEFRASLVATPAFDWNPNSGVIFNAGGNVPAFEIEGSQDIVWPIGKVIGSIYQNYRDCNMSIANTNASVDSWIDNQSGFAGPYAGLSVLKSLTFRGIQSKINNGAASVNPFIPTDYTGGRVDRVDKVRELIHLYNWVLVAELGDSGTPRIHVRMNNTLAVAGHSNWVAIESATFNEINFNLRRISLSTNLDGTNFIVKSRAGNITQAIGMAEGDPIYQGSIDAGGHIYIVEIPGLDTSVTNVVGQTGVMETGQF